MIQERRTINSQFDNVLENIDTYSKFIAVPEKGAIIYAEGYAYYGDGNTWIQLAKLSDIPQIPTFENGYQVAADTRYYDVAHSQGLTAREQIISNDAGALQGQLEEFRRGLFYFKDRVIYTVTISFTAQLSANNQHATLFFGTSGIPWHGYSDVLYFAKGNNVAHTFSRTYQIVGDSGTESEGVAVYLFPSHDGKLWSAQFTIQRAF